MKKIVSAVAVSALLLGASTTAFAASDEDFFKDLIADFCSDGTCASDTTSPKQGGSDANSGAASTDSNAASTTDSSSTASDPSSSGDGKKNEGNVSDNTDSAVCAAEAEKARVANPDDPFAAMDAEMACKERMANAQKDENASSDSAVGKDGSVTAEADKKNEGNLDKNESKPASGSQSPYIVTVSGPVAESQSVSVQKETVGVINSEEKSVVKLDPAKKDEKLQGAKSAELKKASGRALAKTGAGAGVTFGFAALLAVTGVLALRARKH